MILRQAVSLLFPYTTLFRSRLFTGFASDNAPELRPRRASGPRQDRKSTRLNSSHLGNSYAVFCLKKKTEIGWIGDDFAAGCIFHVDSIRNIIDESPQEDALL